MKVIFLFPGYGSQFVGMGKELYDEYRIVQEYFEEASNCLNTNFVKLCFASSDSELARMQHAYPALFLVSCSIFALLQDMKIMPTTVTGYNQGEYAALFSGGSISFPDGLYLLNKLAIFYEQSLEEMEVAAIKVSDVSTEEIENICLKANMWAAGKAFVSIYQTPTINIIAGNYQAVERVRELVVGETNGIVDGISENIGLHSPLMNPVVEQFKIYLEKVDFKDLHTPFIESVNGATIQKAHLVKENVLKSINSSIVWSRILKELDKYDVIVEIGPGTMLSTLAKKEYPDKHILAINNKEDIESLKQLLPQAVDETGE